MVVLRRAVRPDCGETAGTCSRRWRNVERVRRQPLDALLAAAAGPVAGSCRTAVARLPGLRSSSARRVAIARASLASGALCEIAYRRLHKLSKLLSLKLGRSFEAKSECARDSSCTLVTGDGYESLEQPCPHALPVRVRTPQPTHTQLQPS